MVIRTSAALGVSSTTIYNEEEIALYDLRHVIHLRKFDIQHVSRPHVHERKQHLPMIGERRQ